MIIGIGVMLSNQKSQAPPYEFMWYKNLEIFMSGVCDFYKNEIKSTVAQRYWTGRLHAMVRNDIHINM
jgi:hypothetical protein